MAIWKRIRKYRDKYYHDKYYHDMDVTAETEEKLGQTEKGDFFAMWISAMLTLWLPSLVILILLCAAAYVLLGLPFAH